MKTLKMATSVLLMLGFLLSNAIRGVEAATFLGDFCWQTPDGGLVKLGVTDMGGGHFLVHGRATEHGNVEALHGNAEIVGQQVILTVNYSGEDTLETWAGTARGRSTSLGTS